MTYNSGTADGYLDMLDTLEEVITSDHLSTIDVITAPGVNFVVGEIINLDGSGTFTHAAQIEVTGETGGVIDTVRVYRGGAYTGDPDLAANVTVSSGFTADGTATTPGTGATFNLSMLPTGWTVLTREEESVSAVVAVGGSGYTNGDVLTLVGGTLAEGGSPATYTATVGGGVVSSVAQITPGDYEVFPANPVITSVAPAGGIGCTLTVTTQPVVGDHVIVFQGDAGASIDPLVGIKTYSGETDETGASDIFNWALFGMSSWAPANGRLDEQSGISPGFNTGANDGTLTTNNNGEGSFVPMKDSGGNLINWEIRATGRTVELVVWVLGLEEHRIQCGFGLLDQLDVSSEIPFPAFVAGTSDRKRVYYEDTSAIFGGLSEVISRANGPMFAWAPEAAWVQCRAAIITSNQSTTPQYVIDNIAPRAVVWPVGAAKIRAGDDQIWNGAPSAGFDNQDLTLTSGAMQIYRTPDTGGDLFPLFPVVLEQADDPLFRTFGELPGVFWFHRADSGVTSGDNFIRGGARHSIQRNGTRNEPFSLLAIRED